MDYTSSAALAKSLITDFGTTVTILRTSPDSAYNPVTDSVTGVTYTTMVVNAVFLPLINSRTNLDFHMLESLLALGDNAKLLIPASNSSGASLAFVPQPADIVVFGAYSQGSPNLNWWKIDSVSFLEPSRVPIMYTLIITRGAVKL